VVSTKVSWVVISHLISHFTGPGGPRTCRCAEEHGAFRPPGSWWLSTQCIRKHRVHSWSHFLKHCVHSWISTVCIYIKYFEAIRSAVISWVMKSGLAWW